MRLAALVRLGQRRVASALAAVALACAPTTAGAAPEAIFREPDPYTLPDAPAPPTLPDLTHRGLALTLETTFASIRSNARDDGTRPSRAGAWIERLDAEQALSIRRWFLGVAEEIAVGSPPGRTLPTFVPGHVEVYGRSLWASPLGLAYGGGLGVVVPVANHAADSRAADVDSAVRVVRPVDWVYFAPETFTLRPFVDVRGIDGRIILQLRQGIDVALAAGGGETTLTSRTTFYVGYRPIEALGIGAEASEVYFVRAPSVPDDARAIYTLSPSVRLMTRALQPAVSAVFPLDRTLFGVVDSYWALRLHLAIVLDPP